MNKKEALKLARDARDQLRDFNNTDDEIGFDLNSFELDGEKLNVFAYIRKEKDGTRKWYSVYAGVEYDGGDNIYADYDNSTEHLRVSELVDSLYYLANKYEKEEGLNELRRMIDEHNEK